MSDAFNRASWLNERGRHRDAIELCQEALRTEPNDPDLLLIMASALWGVGRDDDSLEVIAQALALSPDYELAHYLRGRIQTSHSKIRQAIESHEEALRCDPHCTVALNALAELCYVDDSQRALKLTEQALEEEPEDLEALYWRSRALSQLEKHDEAIKVAVSAIGIAPDETLSHTAMGWALIAKNQPDIALDHFRQAIRIDPDSADARSGLLETLVERGPLARAALKWSRIVDDDSTAEGWGNIFSLPKTTSDWFWMVWFIGHVVFVRMYIDNWWIALPMILAAPIINFLLLWGLLYLAAWTVMRFDRDGRHLMDDSTAILLDAALGYTVTAIVVISLWAMEAPSVWTFAAALLGFGMVAPLTWVRLSADERAWAVAGIGGFALAYLLGIIPLVLYAGASGLWFQVGCCVGYSAIGFLPLGYLAVADRVGKK